MNCEIETINTEETTEVLNKPNPNEVDSKAEVKSVVNSNVKTETISKNET